ncbi:MAG: hypothetical protein IJP86_06280 [Synergistaceae bacterium]|nr:hypothetical protein [Synergistaceae bacterium]
MEAQEQVTLTVSAARRHEGHSSVVTKYGRVTDDSHRTAACAGQSLKASPSARSKYVSGTGNVTRPSGSDSAVKLTATVTGGGRSASKEFKLRVIKARARTVSSVRASADEDPFTAEIIEAMNESNDAFSIVYAGDGGQVRHVDGKFSELTITNADDALDAAYGIHDALGIADPYAEALPLNVAQDEYGSQYSFRQVYSVAGEPLDVYGRTFMVSANASGDSDFLSSTLRQRPGKSSTRWTVTSRILSRLTP